MFLSVEPQFRVPLHQIDGQLPMFGGLNYPVARMSGGYQTFSEVLDGLVVAGVDGDFRAEQPVQP